MKIEKPKHARYSPSKLEGLENCPCFEYKQWDLPEDGEETPAERGTRLHKAVETEDEKLCKDEAELEQVRMCIGHNQSLLVSSSLPMAGVMKEMRVEIPDLTYGTADHVVLWGDPWAPVEADLVDFKFVKTNSISDPKDNLQLSCYAVGLMYKYPALTTVRARIVAPEVKYVPDPAVFTRDDIPGIEARIRVILADVSDVFKNPRVCDFCSKCQNAGRCPALGATAVVTAKALGLPVPDSFSPGSPVTLQDRAIGQFLKGALAEWGDQIGAANTEFVLQTGQDIPGFKLVTRKGSYALGDEHTVLEILRNNDVSWDVLKPAIKVSASKLLAALAEHWGTDAEETAPKLQELVGPELQRRPDSRFLQRARSKKQGDFLTGLLPEASAK